MASSQLQTIKATGSHLLMFVAGFILKPWFTRAPIPPIVSTPTELTFDQKMLAFLESLTVYFTARMSSMGSRTEIAPVLLISRHSSEIALDMIAKMKRDRSIINELAAEYKSSNNVAGEKACIETLKRYYGGFIISLYVILESNLKIMNLVQAVHPSPAHKYFREKISGINHELQNLRDAFIWQQGSESYFIHRIKDKKGSEWQEQLLSEMIGLGSPEYQGLLERLTHASEYSYKELMIKANKCKIASSVLQDKLDAINAKESTEGLNPEESEEKKYVTDKISRLQRKLSEKITPELEKYSEYHAALSSGAISAVRVTPTP